MYVRRNSALLLVVGVVLAEVLVSSVSSYRKRKTLSSRRIQVRARDWRSGEEEKSWGVMLR